MKAESYLINVSRGGLVDESALFQAFQSGSLAGAAIDCFAEEPYKGDLSHLDNVVLSPHMGSFARETRLAMEEQALENLLSILLAESSGEEL